MSRVIKFRAWHKEGKQMYPVWGMLNDLVSLQTGDEAMLVIGFSLVELMQFTGLQDKNGREVYDGDVYRNLDNGLIGKLYYLNGPGGYALHCRENNQDGSPYNMLPFAQLDTTNFEVIGNTYEHPELIAAE